MIDFLIIYEHKNREIEAVCLLKAELENRGYIVKIIQQHDYSKAWNRIVNNIKVVITFALRNEEYMYNHVYAFARHIRKVVNLQYEQIYSKEALKSGFNNPSGSAKYALHLCWGQNSYKRMLVNNVNNIAIVGSLNLDFLMSKFDNYFLTRKFINEKYGIKTEKILLYISSFSLATLDETSIDRLSYETKIDYNKLRDVSIKSKEDTLDALEKILKKHDDVTVVYRPHPSEYSDLKIKILVEKYETFKCIDDFSVRQWIKVSDYLITWFSTSIIDAFFLEKKIVIYRPIDIPEELDAVIYKDCNSISNYEVLEEELFYGNNTRFPIQRDLINDFYDFNINKPSYIQISDILEKVLLTTEYDLPENFKWKIKFKILLEPIIKKLIELLKLNEKSLLSKLFPRFREWIKYYNNYRKKQIHSIIKDDEINELTEKFKMIISENDVEDRNRRK